MRKIGAIMILFGFISCGLFESKEEKAQELVDQEMQNIDWNAVDNYPLFENCDESVSKAGQKECFEQELISRFSATLKEFEFVLSNDVDTTIYVDFLIDRKGSIAVVNIEKDSKIDVQMPEFDGIITQSLRGLPRLAPALKRGVPVSAKFRIPIILNSN